MAPMRSILLDDSFKKLPTALCSCPLVPCLPKADAKPPFGVDNAPQLNLVGCSRSVLGNGEPTRNGKSQTKCRSVLEVIAWSENLRSIEAEHWVLPETSVLEPRQGNACLQARHAQVRVVEQGEHLALGERHAVRNIETFRRLLTRVSEHVDESPVLRDVANACVYSIHPSVELEWDGGVRLARRSNKCGKAECATCRSTSGP